MASYNGLPPVGYEMEPEEKDQEMRIEFFLEAFRGYIAQTVDYKDLMFFEYFSPDERRKFRNLAKNADNAADVTDQMIETILLMKDKPNRYSSLVRLFETELENEKVLRILKGEKIPTNSNYQKKKIQRVMKAICDNLVIADIIPSLEQHKLIVSRETESLLKMERNSSNFDAAMDLMLIVPNRQENWYPKFIHCLIESGHEFLAKKVDGDMCQKILKYKEIMKIQNSDRSLSTEDQNELFELCEDFGERSLSPIPEEILSMDENSISLYKKALTEGKEAINNIRVMIVGHWGVGKTTLTRRLLGETVDVNEDISSTNGIDVHIKRCKVRLTDANWLPVTKENYQETFYNRFASMIAEFSKNAELQQSGTDVKSSVKVISSDADESCNIRSVKTSIKKKQADDPDSKREFKQQENKYESLLYERESNENKKATDVHFKEMIGDIKNRCTEDSSKDIADLSLWDFAGQYVFYGTHQIFLSRRAIYLLVTDLSQQVDSVVHDDCYIDSRGETRCKISDFVTFWLNSIHTFCGSGKSREPPVILVGTFADKLIEGKKQELADEFFNKLRLSLAESDAFVHLTDAEFMLDNSIIDPNVEKLKREIVMTATKQSYWGELYPARWAILERSLMEFKERGHTVLEKKVLEDTNKNMPLPIETSEELELFLRFHHEAGFILYFSDGKLKDFILLQPQWLVDALKSLITARNFCAKDQELCIYWFEFSNAGILKRDLIDAVWSASSPFHERKDLILEFMEKLGIIARPRQCAGHRNDDVEFYVAPCVLKQTVPDSLIMFNCGGCRSTTKLCFTTPSRIIPVQMFNKLLAECITKWPISKQNGQYLMFCGCGVFDLTDMHEIYVYLRDNVIQIWINTYSEFTELDRDLCLNVRDYITESLCQSVRGSCEIETYVACPESSLKETQCMWKVEYLSEKKEIRCSGHGRRHAVRTSEILKYWVPNITDNDVFTAAFLKQTPKEKQLSRMAQKIGKEFRSLGFELGMTRAELDHIDMDEKNRTPVDKITAMLSHWLKKSACDATFDELYRAMIKTNIDPNNVLTGL